MNNQKIRVAITQGDTNGIGYELIFKTFSAPEMLELCTPIIYGSPKIAAYHRNALDMQAHFSIITSADEALDGRVNLVACFDDDVKVELGVVTEESSHAAIRALDRAMTDYRDGLYDVLVSAPICPSCIKVNNIEFDSLRKYLQTCLGTKEESMYMYLNDFMHVSLIADDLSLKEEIDQVTEVNIINKAAMLYRTLKRDFMIGNPRIAVLSMNPKGDREEEQTVIEPAVARLTDAGMSAFGPYPAETFYGTGMYDVFDGILAMYYDQGILPFKTLSLHEGVCLIANLPLICTMPCSGPHFEDAGRGVADETAFRQAVYLAIDIYRNRISFDSSVVNPLPKLYHERHEERERSRYNGPKRPTRVERPGEAEQ
ncbi:MAG: 4-hydroxythreonine-4-phosphate dehydrogenase PdxA [Prevotella sp.]